MGKEKEIIGGKVVKRWFTRGKARIPVFEDGSIGVPNKASDISRSEYHYEKNKAKTNATYDKLMKVKEKASPKDWEKTRKAYNKYKKAYDKEQEYNKAMASKEPGSRTDDLKGKHIRKSREDYLAEGLSEKEIDRAERINKAINNKEDRELLRKIGKSEEEIDKILTDRELRTREMPKQELEKKVAENNKTLSNQLYTSNSYDEKLLDDTMDMIKRIDNLRDKDDRVLGYDIPAPILNGMSKKYSYNRHGIHYRNRNTGMTKQGKTSDSKYFEKLNKDIDRAKYLDEQEQKKIDEREYFKKMDRDIAKQEETINDIKIEAEDRKEFADNAINKIKQEKIARIEKRATTEKAKEYKIADNQMEAKIERYKEGKGKKLNETMDKRQAIIEGLDKSTKDLDAYDLYNLAISKLETKSYTTPTERQYWAGIIERYKKDMRNR